MALGVGVVFDGSHLAGEVGGADDVDAGEGQQQDVGRLRQAAGDLAFQGLDFLGFSLAIVVQGQGDAAMLGGGDVAGRRPARPSRGRPARVRCWKRMPAWRSE